MNEEKLLHPVLMMLCIVKFFAIRIFYHLYLYMYKNLFR